MLRQTPRTFVERARLPHERPAARVSVVVTDLGVLEPRGEERELTLTSRPSRRRRRAGARGDRLGAARRRRPARDAARRPRRSCAALRGARSRQEPTRDRDRPAVPLPDYRSTVTRAPSRRCCRCPRSSTGSPRPSSARTRSRPGDADLTTGHAGEPLGERIIVTGASSTRTAGRCANALLEVWQANAAGRYAHEVDQHPAPLDPNFTGAGRTLTDDDGRYRFVTVKPGAYPWQNHPNAWRPAHIHFSVFGRAFTQRLVTQMYFPGDPLFAYDPIFNSVRDPAARERLVARFDLETTEPEWALGYHVGHRPAKDAVRGMRTPSQTVGPFFALGLCAEPQNELPGGTRPHRGAGVRRRGRAGRRRAARALGPDARLRPLRAPTARAASRSSSRRSRPLRAAGVRARAAQARPHAALPRRRRRRGRDDGRARGGDGFRFDVRLQGEARTAFFEL